LIDNRSCIIAGVIATPARLSQEIIAARQMSERAKERCRNCSHKSACTPSSTELRNQIRLRNVRLRGLRNAKEQFILAATAQNVKRLMKYLSQPKEAAAGIA
jgi:hypothetical protein